MGNIIEIYDDKDTQVITINSLNNKELDTQCLSIDESELNNISDIIFQSIPIMGINAQTYGKTIMEVSVNGNLTPAIGGGYRAIVKGADGKIKEHATLFDAKSLKKIVSLATIWQVASIVVAQSHLSDINKKLEKINEKVSEIISYQQDERETSILAIQQQLNEKMEYMPKDPEKRKQFLSLDLLDKHDYVLLQKYLHLTKELKNQEQKIEHNESFGTEELKNDITKKIRDIDRIAQQIYSCLILRLIITELRISIHQIDEKTINPRQPIFTQITEYLSTVTKIIKIVANEIKNMNSKTNKIQSKLGFSNKMDENDISKLDSLLNDEDLFDNERMQRMPTSHFSGIGGVVSFMAVAISPASLVAKALNSDNISTNDGIIGKRKLELLSNLKKTSTIVNEQKKLSDNVSQYIQNQLNNKNPLKLTFEINSENSIRCINTGDVIKKQLVS